MSERAFLLEPGLAHETRMIDFSGKHAFVTGSGSGIGAAVTQALAQAGARVTGLDRRPSDPAAHSHHDVDLAEPASIDAAVSAVAGPIDALFNCAGLAPTQPLIPVVRVNFLGQRHLTEALLPMMPRGSAIVSTSSNGGLEWRTRRAMLGAFLDCAGFEAGLAWLQENSAEIANGYRFAKEALTLWTLRQSHVLIGRGIRINCTSPGAVSTPMLREIEDKIPAAAIDATTRPIGRRSVPNEQAGPLLFLASEAASYINGVDLPVDGGFAALFTLRDSKPPSSGNA